MLNAGLAVAVLCLLGSCSAAGPMYQDTGFALQPVPNDMARIVFIRGYDVDFRSATLAIDGAVIGGLDQNGFVVANVEPGDRAISARVRYVPLGEYTHTYDERQRG
jgi:hypothetical protein